MVGLLHCVHACPETLTEHHQTQLTQALHRSCWPAACCGVEWIWQQHLNAQKLCVTYATCHAPCSAPCSTYHLSPAKHTAVTLGSAFYIVHSIDRVQVQVFYSCSITKGGNTRGYISLNNSTTYSLVSDASLGPEPRSCSLPAPGRRLVSAFLCASGLDHCS